MRRLRWAPTWKSLRSTTSATHRTQVAIEADLRRLVEEGLDLPDADLANLCERGARNHDPCVSCAAHFLRLDLQRA